MASLKRPLENDYATSILVHPTPCAVPHAPGTPPKKISWDAEVADTTSPLRKYPADTAPPKALGTAGLHGLEEDLQGDAPPEDYPLPLALSPSQQVKRRR
eukprot:TRINITY_DN8696_c0_g3_i1.p2 TRINITY_DN8696_c0_g3~~TRINITY_DN8696_c0_g3_i1.p2  ORF type:complete len:100 (+),score=32.87 TRINITY_DN8696_c0_g3_i1:169-468(+)